MTKLIPIQGSTPKKSLRDVFNALHKIVASEATLEVIFYSFNEYTPEELTTIKSISYRSDWGEVANYIDDYQKFGTVEKCRAFYAEKTRKAQRLEAIDLYRSGHPEILRSLMKGSVNP